MNFISACEFCYNEFQKEDATIGKIRDCGEYWIFYKKCEEDEYGTVPIIVYKGDKQPIVMTFDLFLKLAPEIEKAILIEVPQEFFSCNKRK